MKRNTDIFRRYGLRQGMLGDALDILLDSESNVDKHKEGQRMLNGLLREYRLMPKGVAHGRWGLVPAIDLLMSCGFIKPSAYWDSVISAQMREMLFLSYGAAPIRLTAEDDFIAEGVMCAAAYRSLQEPLERLRLLERMIALVDEFEILLLADPSPYTGSARLNARQLHSMLHYLLYMDSLNAYPEKMRKVGRMFLDYCDETEMPDDGDRALLLYLLGKTSLPNPTTDDERFFHKLYGLHSSDGECKNHNIADVIEKWRAWDKKRSEAESILPVNSKADPKVLGEELTILMTLRVDSEERLRNYRACVSFLLKHTDVRIMVTEADTFSRGNIFPQEDRVTYRFEKDDNRIFHRTAYMNHMLRECSTPYAALWDIDAIGDPQALATAVGVLRQGEATMAYPYNGRFWSLTDFFSQAFSVTLNLRTLSELPQPRHLMAGYHSVGGAFVVDVEKYRQMGWENENFKGWGPEDMERYRRLEICGRRPLRIDADLYHLGHPRGINSSSSDSELAMSTKRELLNVCSMTDRELTDYISTWPWKEKDKHC